MTPVALIKQAAADGVRIALTDTDTVKVSGDQVAVNRWLPAIREHKPGIVAALQEAVNDEPLSDPRAEARRSRVLSMLSQNPSVTYAALTDLDADPEAALLTLAIRGRATCELRIPREKYDPFLLLDLLDRHGATVH